MTPPLHTPRRDDILRFLRQCRAEFYPPSFADVGDAVGISSPSATLYQLRVLREHGMIAWDEGKQRTLRLTFDGVRMAQELPPLKE
jgi:SOS-response transcriptional repressor LexA